MSKKEFSFKKNRQITAKEVRLVGIDGASKVVSIYEAAKLAQEEGLDLIEISPNAVPPVCKIEDYNKFVYDLAKKKKDSEKNHHKSELKEIRLSQNIGDNDLKTKANKAIELLNGGDKIRAVLMFKGRGIVYKEQGEEIILKFSQMIEDSGLPEAMPELVGKKMTMNFKPKKK